MTRRRRHEQGYLILDAIVALSVLSVMVLALGSASGHSHRAARVLSDKRAATRIAEQVLAGDTTQRYEAQIDVADAGDGWKTVTVQYGQATASLTGWEGAR